MPPTCLVFGDIEDELDLLRVECTRCGRKGRYQRRAKKARLCRVSCRTSAEMASHQLFPAASLGQSQHSRAYPR